MTPGDQFVIVIQVPAGRLPTFRGQSWVAVEANADEKAARARFHALRPALSGLKAAAVMMKAAITAEMKVEPLRTIMSKDAEFWRLRSAEIAVASREQIQDWRTAVDALMAQDEAEAMARRPGQRAPAAPKRAGAAVLGVGLAVALGLALTIAVRGLRGDGNVVAAGPPTFFQSDPRDPSIVIEYTLGQDGTRHVVRRITREQLESGQTAAADQAAANKPKTLADGINVFLRVRQ